MKIYLCHVVPKTQLNLVIVLRSVSDSDFFSARNSEFTADNKNSPHRAPRMPLGCC